MKKALFLTIIFLFFAMPVFALSKPRWDVRPIKVYIPSGSYSSKIMKNAFLEWQNRTNSAVWFTFISDNKKGEENITVHFVETNTQCNSSQAIGCTHSYISPENFYTHVDIFIASKSVQQLTGDDGTTARKTSVIPAPQLYRVMIHEIGHALGINTHSTKPGSVMYPYTLDSVNIPQHLTDDDLNYVYNVYR